MCGDCCGKGRGLRWEAIAKHGKATHGFFLRGFVLQHVPVLCQETVFESDNIGRNPGCWPSHPSEPAMRDDVVAFCDDELVFIAQGIWRRANKVEQPLASRPNVRAVLDVRRRPEGFCCRVVAFVEERIEGFENNRLVLFGCCLGHITSWSSVRVIDKLGNRNSRVAPRRRRFPSPLQQEGYCRQTSGPGRDLRYRDDRKPPDLPSLRR